MTCMTIRPKYHVGDVLYRKDTQKKSEIKQIVLFKHQSYTDVKLCYFVEEPLNDSSCWSDVYLQVEVVDNDPNFCDFKVSGEPKYKAGDKIQCLSNGRVVQIDLVAANEHSHGYPWRYHVTPWLFCPSEDGYHYCGHIDGNTFIHKTDKQVSARHKYNHGDVIVVENKHSVLVEAAHSGNYQLSAGVPIYKGANKGDNYLTWEAVDTNSDIRIANPLEVEDYLVHHHKSKYNVGQYVWDASANQEYFITKKVIREVDYIQSNVYFELMPVYSGVEMKYVLTKVADVYLEPCNTTYGHIQCPFERASSHPQNPLLVETKEASINRKAMEIWEFTYKATLERESELTKPYVELALRNANAAKNDFMEQFKRNKND